MVEKQAVAKNQGEPSGVKSRALSKNSGEPKVDKDKDRVSVTDEALATIIGLAAHEVPGVVGMAPAGIREGIKRILGVAQADEGVEVSREEECVDLHVVVAYGVNIPAVADSIRERVLYAAQTFAGVDLDAVRIHIDGVSRGEEVSRG